MASRRSAFRSTDTNPDFATVLTLSAVTPKSALGTDVTLSSNNLIYAPTTSSNLNAVANKEFTTDIATHEHGLSSDAVVTILAARG